MRHARARAVRLGAVFLGLAWIGPPISGCGGPQGGTAVISTTDEELKQMEEESRSNEALDKAAAKKRPR